MGGVRLEAGGATGGYERHLPEICEELGIAAHKAHGSRVRHFAKISWPYCQKRSDRCARACPLRLENREPAPLFPPHARAGGLDRSEARRDQIQAMLLAETNRLEHVRHASVPAGSRSISQSSVKPSHFQGPVTEASIPVIAAPRTPDDAFVSMNVSFARTELQRGFPRAKRHSGAKPPVRDNFGRAQG